MAAPILDHHRLMVPKIRLALEFVHFVILFASYLAVVFSAFRSGRHLGMKEIG